MSVQHIALFQFKVGTSADLIRSVSDHLARLAKDIPGITDFSIGTNNSPEGLAGGLTHGFVMTFQDAAARDNYLTHPEHEEFKAAALPHIEKVVVFDYEK
ncbi:MAG TPA: Dabb family protein [Candidatus Limnocylindria bacterium]|nr:Dabb family protein [Candidatus Limnocylindria bacterium]